MRNQNSQAVVSAKLQTFQGPLPPPESLEEYDRIIFVSAIVYYAIYKGMEGTAIAAIVTSLCSVAGVFLLYKRNSRKDIL